MLAGSLMEACGRQLSLAAAEVPAATREARAAARLLRDSDAHDTSASRSAVTARVRKPVRSGRGEGSRLSESLGRPQALIVFWCSSDCREACKVAAPCSFCK